MHPKRPGRLVKVRGGGIGPGLAGSLGAALARPDRKVVGICSDGASMYSITALWTAAHHRIPVTYVMLSNRAYRILKLNMLEYLGPEAPRREFVAMDLVDPELRFDRMAERWASRPGGSSGQKSWRACCAKRSTTRAAHSWWTWCWTARYLRASRQSGLTAGRKCDRSRFDPNKAVGKGVFPDSKTRAVAPPSFHRVRVRSRAASHPDQEFTHWRVN